MPKPNPRDRALRLYTRAMNSAYATLTKRSEELGQSREMFLAQKAIADGALESVAALRTEIEAFEERVKNLEGTEELYNAATDRLLAQDKEIDDLKAKVDYHVEASGRRGKAIEAKDAEIERLRREVAEANDLAEHRGRTIKNLKVKLHDTELRLSRAEGYQSRVIEDDIIREDAHYLRPPVTSPVHAPLVRSGTVGTQTGYEPPAHDIHRGYVAVNEPLKHWLDW